MTAHFWQIVLFCVSPYCQSPPAYLAARESQFNTQEQCEEARKIVDRLAGDWQRGDALMACQEFVLGPPAVVVHP